MATNRRIQLARGRLAEKRSDWAQAVEVYRSLDSSLDELSNGDVLYRHGHALIQLGRFVEAASVLEKAATADPTNTHWVYRWASVLQKLERWSEAADAFEMAINLDDTLADWHYRLGLCQEKLGRVANSIASFRFAIGLDRSKRYYFEALLRVSRRTGQQWMVNEVLGDASDAFPEDKTWKRKLAESYAGTRNAAKAAEFFGEINSLGGTDFLSHYREGLALQKLGKTGAANRAFEQAIGKDKKLKSNIFGVGAIHQHFGDYISAASSYLKTSFSSGDNAEIHYRRGFSLERSYRWEEAAQAYETALMLSPEKESWFYRLGLVRERLQDWKAAVSAYATACKLHVGRNGYWLYRQAYCLQKLGDFEASCQVYALIYRGGPLPSADLPIVEGSQAEDAPRHLTWSASRVDTILCLQSAAASYSAGIALHADGDLDGAAILLTDACQRISSHEPSYYRALAEALFAAGQFESAAIAYAQTQVIRRPHGISMQKYAKSSETTRQLQYAEYYDVLPLEENVVLYESGAGSFVGCNPLAIYRSLISNAKYSNLRHVWVINDSSRIPEDLRGEAGVVFIGRTSDAYIRYLASAKYLINNNTFPPFFSRKPGQLYLNTWHGVPLKTLGKDIPGGEMEHKNAARNLLHATHLLAPNQHTLDVLLERNDIQGVFSGKAAILGYPRVDQVVSPSGARRGSLRQRLEIGQDERVLLYAPTWRGDLRRRSLDDEKILEDLGELAKTGCRVLFKGHAMLERELASSRLSDLIVPGDIDTNDLLGIVDVLVTDYSSILFDFMPKKSELYLYAYDLDAYSAQRGLYFTLEDLPGTVCLDIDHLVESIRSGKAAEIGEVAHLQALSQFCPRDDGGATERAIEFFFECSEKDIVSVHDSKETVLFFQGSFIPNGVTSAFKSVVRGMDRSKYRPVVVLEPGAVHREPSRLEEFNDLKSEIQTIPRVGNHVVNLEERWVIDRLNGRHELDHARMWQIHNAAFAKEFRRLFGDSEFSSIVCFEGYARFWAAVLANGPKPHGSRSIYLHNDMVRELETRFAYLHALFQSYEQYDRLISVSKSVGEINQDELSRRYSVPDEKFEFVNNQIEYERMREQAALPIEPSLAAWIDQADYAFVNVARLSPEKDQAKLLRALAKVRSKSGIDVRLVVVGAGPLYQQLRQLARQLELHRSVWFTGLERNPYAIMSACDGFVFSSNYEGQGLVVLEALVLGLPVVSTDVVGPRSILEGGLGLLVENGVSGLEEGMLSLCSRVPKKVDFDPGSYNQEAREKFEKLVLGS